MKHYGNILEAMNALITAMNEEHIRLVAESNAQAEEARLLVARVQNTIAHHEELTAVIGEAAKQLTTKQTAMETATSNIKDALSILNDGEIPMCAVEQFEGYCAQCGEELTTGGAWEYDEGGEPVCAVCREKQTPEETEETPENTEVVEQ